MPRYIDAEAFVADKRKQYCDNCPKKDCFTTLTRLNGNEVAETACSNCKYGSFIDDIEEFPTADVQEVKHGRWDELKEENRYCVCSVCHGCYFTRKWIASCKWKYCPNCGAKMDLEDSNGN